MIIYYFFSMNFFYIHDSEYTYYVYPKRGYYDAYILPLSPTSYCWLLSLYKTLSNHYLPKNSYFPIHIIVHIVVTFITYITKNKSSYTSFTRSLDKSLIPTKESIQS